jgi:RNA polymerase sigma factor (sigma-70 family)
VPIRKEEKFKEWFLADTEKEAEDVYHKHIRTIRSIANTYSNLSGVDRDDLVQEGLIGLARAARDFEEDRSDNFKIFAIYKIKDSMREFVNSQIKNIKIPQYIVDAIRLMNYLKRILNDVDYANNKAFLEIWNLSKKYEHQADEIGNQISVVKDRIKNLAERSQTTVEDLLYRVELFDSGYYNTINVSKTDYLKNESEKDVLNKLGALKAVEKVRQLLTEDEYCLLYDYFANGKTERELAEKFGIRASSVHMRLKKIKHRLNIRKKEIFNDT